MQIALQILALAGGLAVALVASSSAVDNARRLASRLGAPSFVIGVAVVALGTDLPEIANSIAAHLQGEGDVNVGDSAGSVLAQYTLVLGVIPLVARRSLPIDRREVAVVGLATLPGLAIAAWAVADGHLGRPEGAGLVVAWAVLLGLIVSALPRAVAEEVPGDVGPRANVLVLVTKVIVGIALVGAGASLAVWALIDLAESAGVPELLIAYFGAAAATSAPELAVGLTALLRGAPGIALGDAVGASFVDSTLSMGIGPLIAPAAVSAGLGLAAVGYAGAAVAIVGLLLVVRGRLDRRAGIALLAIYAAAYVVLIAGS